MIKPDRVGTITELTNALSLYKQLALFPEFSRTGVWQYMDALLALLEHDAPRLLDINLNPPKDTL